MKKEKLTPEQYSKLVAEHARSDGYPMTQSELLTRVRETFPDKQLTNSQERDLRDRYIIDHADYFTIIRFLGVGQYERHERKTLKKAETLAKKLVKENKGRYMIYAVQGIHDAFVKGVS